MSNKNDRWSALSMKERADLMNMYITNGISDLKEIKKHYNSFGDGGRILDGNEKEQTLSGKKPTLEEFIQAKADSTRNAALDKSYTRVKGIEIPYEFGEGEKSSVQKTFEYSEPYVRFTHGPYTKNEEDNIKTINYHLGLYYQAKKELEDNCKYGFNCIGTATDNYPEESRTVSNKDFDENFEKYGFQYVGMKNAKPGDIAKTPNHAMIYVGTDVNGNPLFNYSDGGITEYNYKKDARYPASYYGVYTYVGTPKLIQQWTSEYEDTYNKKHGGKINKFNSFSGEENQDNNIVYYDNTPIETPIVKAFNSEEDYNRYYGEQFGKKVTKGTNNIAQSIFEGLKYTPLIGDVLDAENAAIDAYNGNYKEALTLAGMALIPNVIEKPIKGIKRGVKNLLTYKKYASQPERFRRSVDEIVDRYAKNANLLNSNYGGTDTNRVLNTKEDLINANKNLSITTNYIPSSRKTGGKYNGDIWINPYGKGRLKKAWRSPIEAIKDLHGTAAHEGTHFALDNLNDKLTIYDASRKYHKANPNHPLYQDVGYIFDDLNREATSWERSPEEFIAELNKFRVNNNIPNHLGYNQWKPIQKRMAQTAMANRFKLRPEDASYIAPEDIDYILSKYANFGYKNGGKLTKYVNKFGN